MILSVDEPTSTQLRRFYEGAVCPYFAYQHLLVDEKRQCWRRMGFPEAREALKLEFNPIYIKSIKGSRETVGGTTTAFNKEEFREYVEKILSWFEQNGYEKPDSEEYKKWVSSAPMLGEVYPPLERIIKISDKKLVELNNGV